jgi:hypothetical protein
MNSLTLPDYVVGFIKDLVISENLNSVFDPWLTMSSPSLQVGAIGLRGICKNHSELESIKSSLTGTEFHFILGDPLKEIPRIQDAFDLILSFPPFGMCIFRSS